MKKLLLALLLLIPGISFASCAQPSHGIGCDIPTSVTATHSVTNATTVTFAWNTTLSSDSQVVLIDQFGNEGHAWYDPTMVSCVATVCAHSMTITDLNGAVPPATQTYAVSSCSHATFGNVGTKCPLTSQDWSSTGPGGRERPLLTYQTIANPQSVPLSSWFLQTNAPAHVFQGQNFYIYNIVGVGNGLLSNTTGGVNYVLMENVQVVDNTSSTTYNCGSGTIFTSPAYRPFGDATGIATCTGGAASGDFIITMDTGNNFVYPSTSNYNAFSYTAAGGTLYTAGQRGYYISPFTGQPIYIYVKVGSAVAAHNFTINLDIQPLVSGGTGNQTTDTYDITGQKKTVSVTFDVQALTPLANTPPSSFPAWTFKPEFYTMMNYWGSWDCSHLQAPTSGLTSWASMQHSGLYEDVFFSPFSNFVGPTLGWGYDGGRNNIGIMDQLFPTGVSTYPAWVAGHTYTIGDRVTVAGTTYILELVDGVNTPTTTGVSGPTTPGFTPNSAPFATTLDTGNGNNLQWRTAGNPTYWQGCAVQANEGYRNNILLSQSGSMSEPTEWVMGMLEMAYRTGDASAGDATGFSYQEKNQHYDTTLFTSNTPANIRYPTDPTMFETGSSTSWVGGTKMAFGYMGSYLQNPNGRNPNSNALAGARIKGLSLEGRVGDWLIRNDPTWINTSQDGLATLRSVDTAMALLDMFWNETAEQVQIQDSNGGAAAPFYQSGQIAEALLHYYQATVYYSTGAFSGSGIVPDERIPVALKAWADASWVNDFDVVYDKNVLETDACYTSGHTSICQNSRRLHSYAFPYNRFEHVDPMVGDDFVTETGSNSEIGWVYAWLWARDHTMVPPSNGRESVSTYWDIATLVFQHAFDGRSCLAPTPTVAGSCSSWGVADYVNGGSSTGGGYKNVAPTAKQVNQTLSNITSEALHWLDGTWDSTQGVAIPTSNPCWIVANRDPTTGACTTASPFPDLQAPIPWNLYLNGAGPNVSEPVLCIPGTTVNTPRSLCSSVTTLGSAAVRMQDAIVAATTATFTVMTSKKPTTLCLAVGTTVAEPAHVAGVNYFCGATTPVMVGDTPVPLWYSKITATGLAPSTTYHFGVHIVDGAGNTYDYPYQISNALNVYSVAPKEQAQTFATTPGPSGIGMRIFSGVTIGAGIPKIK